MTSRGPDRVTLAAFVLAVLLAGANGLAIGFSNDELAPYWGATLRFLAAGLVCAAIVAVRRYPIPRGRALLGMVLYGVLAIAFAFGLLHGFGFAGVLAGPLVRSSYRAGRLYQQAIEARGLTRQG